MRVRLWLGPVSVLLLDPTGARAAEPVPDPGRVRISYEQRSRIHTAVTGTETAAHSRGAELLAEWTVSSADEKRIVLRARVIEATLHCSRPKAGAENPELEDETCTAELKAGELEVTLTRTSAVVRDGLAPLLARAQVHLDRGASQIGVVPEYALEPLARAVSSAVFEAFVHLLPPPKPGTAELRQIDVRAEGGQEGGVFELAFPAATEWRPGELSWASGTCRFTPPKGKATELPDRPVRLTWSRRGRRHAEWTAELEHPSTNLTPGSFDTRRRVAVEVKHSARWLGEAAAEAAGETSSAEATLDRVELVPGQRFLLELTAKEELRAFEGARTSRLWHEVSALLGLAVTGAPGAAGGARFEGLFLAGKLRESAVTGVSPAKARDPASLQVVPSLAGVAITVATGKGEVSVAIDDASWRRALGPATVAKDARRAAALQAALVRATQTWMQSTLGETAPGSDPIWSASLLDGAGKPAGSVALGVDRTAIPQVSKYRLGGREVEQKAFLLEAAWQAPLAPVPRQDQSSAQRLWRAADALLPFPAQATLQIGLDARDAKAPAASPATRTIWVQTRLTSRQIGGPRYRPARPAPAPAAPAAPAAAPPLDTSPLPPPELTAAAPAAVQAKVRSVFSDLPAGWAGVDAALERYAALELAEPRSHAAAAVHAEIVHGLRDRVEAGSLAAIARHLAPASPFPVRVLAMRLVTHAPELKDPERAATLAPLLADADRFTVRFAGHFLGWIRDAASVEALIAALEILEAGVQPGKQEPLADRELRLSLAGDLYRLLGEGASRTAAAGFRDLWQRRGKKLPDDPFAPGSATSATMVRAYRTFADVRSPPIVYLLDASSSMAQPIPAGGIPLPPGDGDPNPGVLEKLEWARRDLGAILGDLEPGTRLQIIAFNKMTKALHAALTTLSKGTLASARTFLKGVRSQRGTNIHAAFEKAFELSDVGAICLLSDGHPTVGPGPDEIDRDVFRWGYLRGARIVAASFTGDIAQPDNLCTRLARRHFGWVRALDAGAVATPNDPALPPRSPQTAEDEED